MRVLYTARALRDVDDILKAIAADTPSAAGRVAARIEATVALLASQPRLGRRRDSRADHIRAFAVRPYPYLIVYALRDDRLEILTIWHMSRDPGGMLP